MGEGSPLCVDFTYDRAFEQWFMPRDSFFGVSALPMLTRLAGCAARLRIDAHNDESIKMARHVIHHAGPRLQVVEFVGDASPKCLRSLAKKTNQLRPMLLSLELPPGASTMRHIPLREMLAVQGADTIVIRGDPRTYVMWETGCVAEGAPHLRAFMAPGINMALLGGAEAFGAHNFPNLELLQVDLLPEDELLVPGEAPPRLGALYMQVLMSLVHTLPALKFLHLFDARSEGELATPAFEPRQLPSLEELEYRMPLDATSSFDWCHDLFLTMPRLRRVTCLRTGTVREGNTVEATLERMHHLTVFALSMATPALGAAMPAVDCEWRGTTVRITAAAVGMPAQPDSLRIGEMSILYTTVRC